MFKHKVAVDLDGVVYDFGNALYNEMVIHQNYMGSYEQFWTKDAFEYSEAWWDFYTSILFLYTNQLPRQQDLDVLNRLAQKYDIYYMTKRPACTRFTTAHYLKTYNFPNYKNLIFTKDKGKMCNLLHIDYAIEDQSVLVKDLLEHGVQTIAINRLWNRGLLPDCITVNDFCEVEEIL